MSINRIYLKEVGPFDEVMINLPSGNKPNLADVYLLTGANGSGKSTILYAIAGLVGGSEEQLGSAALAELRVRGVDSLAAIEGKHHRRAMQKKSSSNCHDPFDSGLLYKSARSRDLTFYDVRPSMAELASEYPRKSKKPPRFYNNPDSLRRFEWAAFAYAAMRSLSNSRVALIQEPTDNPFDNCLSFIATSDSNRIGQWIANQDFKRLKAKDRGDLERAEEYSRSIRSAEFIISEIIGIDFSFEIGVDDNNVRARQNGIVVDLGLLPDGLKSIVSWIADLLMRLDRIPWVDDIPPMQRSFLLLLDEIDIHLHPAWQRKVLPIVQRMFPNAQIIASTHSPFVVASAEDAHIVALKVDNGVASVEGIYPSQIGVSYSAVLRSIFGIDSEFDVETERVFSEFHEAKRQLLSGGTADRSTVQQLAAQLAKRSEEVEQLVGIELRQIERQLGKRGA